MKNQRYSQILDALANEHLPSDLDLAPRILSQIEKGKRKPMNRTLKVVIPVVTTLLIMAVVTVTVPAVAQAVQRWFGYVPGFGLVGRENLRTLPQPVSVTQDGVTLTVDSILSSSEKTIITYTLGGLTPEMISTTDLCNPDINDPKLLLSDGSALPIIGFGVASTEPTYVFEVTTTGIPADVNDLTLKITCVWRTQPDLVPQEWEVPLSLSTDPRTQLTAAPIIDVTEPAATGAGMEVLQAVPLADGVILSGTLSASAPEGFVISEEDGFFDSMTVTDANGQALMIIPAEFGFISNLSEEQKAGKIPWAIQAMGTEIAWPLTINVDSIRAIGPDFEPTSFQVDLGSEMQPGDPLALNLDVPIGPKTLHVIDVKVIDFGQGSRYISFSFTNDPSFDFSYQIEGYMPTGGGGGGGGDTESVISLARAYGDPFPTGLVTLQFTGYPVAQVTGPWQVIVEEPVTP